MKEKDFDTLVRSEYRKIIRVLKNAKISEHNMKVLDPVIENVAWMKLKLDEAREGLIYEPLVVEYNHGGGQNGVKKNPFFDSYESLFKSYMLGMDRILDALPEDKHEKFESEIKEAKPQTVLELVRAKHG